MKVDVADIKRMLNEVLDMKISREDASNWALKLREAGDKKEIEYSPIEDERLIWDGLLFIEGIDIQDNPNSYLHNDHDIRIFLKSL